MRSKADMSRLNLPHGNDKNCKTEKLKSKTDMLEVTVKVITLVTLLFYVFTFFFFTCIVFYLPLFYHTFSKL